MADTAIAVPTAVTDQSEVNSEPLPDSIDETTPTTANGGGADATANANAKADAKSKSKSKSNAKVVVTQRTDELESKYGALVEEFVGAMRDSGISERMLRSFSGCDSVSTDDRFFRPWLLRFLSARSGHVAKCVAMVWDCLRHFEISDFRHAKHSSRCYSVLAEPLPKATQEHIHANYHEGVLPHLDKHNRLVYVLRGSYAHFTKC